MNDQWTAATTYEHFMGRWSRSLADVFIDWLQPAPALHWLEIGCGTGALTSAICRCAAPSTVIAIDPAQPFIDYARSHFTDTRVTFALAGIDDLPQRAGGYDSITSLLALNFFPDPAASVRRMQEATRPGGVVSACVWDYAEGMQFLRYFWNAATAEFPRAAQYDEGPRFPVCRPYELQQLFTAAGLVAVACEPVEIRTAFAHFDDYWNPFLGGTGPAPSFVASLSDAERAQLRLRLERMLPAASDGTIALQARAWAVRGQRLGATVH